jgi:Family of unknown function (DUF5681)
MSEYKIGYGKPPKSGQFKRGRSGNPKGRPKGSQKLATDLAAELNEQITVREDGKSRRVSKQRALIKSLMAKALQGDVPQDGGCPLPHKLWRLCVCRLRGGASARTALSQLAYRLHLSSSSGGDGSRASAYPLDS